MEISKLALIFGLLSTVAVSARTTVTKTEMINSTDILIRVKNHNLTNIGTLSEINNFMQDHCNALGGDLDLDFKVSSDGSGSRGGIFVCRNVIRPEEERQE